MKELNLPVNTVVNKSISKKMVMEQLKENKKIVFDDVRKIVWSNKLNKTTIHIEPTRNVEEIQVFIIFLKTNKIPKKFLKIMYKTVPYPILFKFKYENNFCYAIFLLNGDKIFNSKWNEEILFNFTGTNLEHLYENIILSFLNNLTNINKQNNHKFQELVYIDSNIHKLKKEITSLEIKLRREKQLNKQMNINNQLKNKKKELEKWEEK